MNCKQLAEDIFGFYGLEDMDIEERGTFGSTGGGIWVKNLEDEDLESLLCTAHECFHEIHLDLDIEASKSFFDPALFEATLQDWEDCLHDEWNASFAAILYLESIHGLPAHLLIDAAIGDEKEGFLSYFYGFKMSEHGTDGRWGCVRQDGLKAEFVKAYRKVMFGK